MILVDEISKAFGRKLAVDTLSMAVEDGRIVGFIGPNGAGKSTLMRIALGLEHADSGVVSFDGSPYAQMRNPQRQVGSLLDTKSLPPDLKVREVLEYCARAQGMPTTLVMSVLEDVFLHRATNKRVKQLSLGMRQRLGLAIALLGSPGNYVLDEPLNGLDPSGILWLRELLLRLKEQGSAVLLSSHVMSELAFVVDDVVIINQGAVMLNSSMDELRSRAAPRVHVASSNNDLLIDGLKTIGASIVSSKPNGFTLQGLLPGQVFQVAVSRGVELMELRPEDISLDRIYTELTSPHSPSPQNFQEV